MIKRLLKRLTHPISRHTIYATGFQKRLIPVEGMQTLAYNDRSGIIAPGLFGLGIAFPEAKVDRYGTLEYRVGLWKFMEYLNLVMPIWLDMYLEKSSQDHLAQYIEQEY